MLRVNTKVIAKFNPCKDRFNNWEVNYSKFNGDILDFLSLDNITPQDKIWVSVRLLSRELLELFAIDSAFSAYAAADAAYDAYAAADAADAAAAAADAAYDAYAAAATYAAAAYAAAAYAAADAAYDAAAYSAYYAATYAADAAAAAADAAYAARNKEYENRVDCLIYLITESRK